MNNKIECIIHPFETIANIVNDSSNRIEALLRQERFERAAFYLTDQVLHSNGIGITDERLSDNEIIVSLTSFGRRIYDVYLAIESIMQGTLKPNRIILWLSEEEFKKKELPTILKKQQERGLEIKYCKDIKSYKKIINTLKDFPEASIITIDDDLIYNFDLVENLVQAHKKNPNCIWANRIHEMTYNENGFLKNYLQWKWNSQIGAKDSRNNFFTSGGGTLFPPHSLNDEIFNEDVFMELCPTADDVWLNAMARLQKTEICKSFTHDPMGNDFLVNVNLQADGLSSINNAPQNNQNDVQIKAVFERYGITI